VTVSRFLTAHRMIEVGDRLTSESALAAFLDRLVGRHSASACRRSDNVVRSGLRRARDLVEMNLTECVPLDRLAVAAGISKFHLVRQFARAFGLPPHAYQVRVRIARARELLASGVAVKQVSTELGFADQSHFGRHFRNVTALTPAEYQRRVTGRTRAEIPLDRPLKFT
jgi:transcriptional regulator GlxA family with amidase domain